MRRVIAPDREFSRYRRLLRPASYEPRFRPSAKRQAQRVEQDRFAGTRLPGQDAQPGAKGEVETVDQDDIADMKTQQHCKQRWWRQSMI